MPATSEAKSEQQGESPYYFATWELSKYLNQHLSEHHTELLIGFLISFTFWNILNIIFMNLRLKDGHLSRNDWLDLRNRLTSIVHGALAILPSFYNTYFVHS
jgi:hypothetical protein